MRVYRKWVYHLDHSPKIIEESEIEAHKAAGWKDSPAELDGTYDRLKESLDNKEILPKEINAIGEMYSDIVEIENFKLNIESERSKKKIIKFLKDRDTGETPLDIPENASLKDLRKMVLAL